ncbi:MAG: OB-fold domain-containing protein [Streptosporangiales bacterium]|nr:OB-fold domain-containing protein [Streptosporangiales bacterium]
MPRVIPPVPVRDDEFFWTGVAEHKLLARSCAACGLLQHPPTPMCPACGGLEWNAKELSGAGFVYSWIVSRHPTQPDAEPRIVAVIALDEGIRMVANLSGVDVKDVRNNMRVAVHFEDFDGVTLPQFRPAAPEGEH